MFQKGDLLPRVLLPWRDQHHQQNSSLAGFGLLRAIAALAQKTASSRWVMARDSSRDGGHASHMDLANRWASMRNDTYLAG